jgi:hypothetical protein
MKAPGNRRRHSVGGRGQQLSPPVPEGDGTVSTQSGQPVCSQAGQPPASGDRREDAGGVNSMGKQNGTSLYWGTQ